MLPLTLKDKRSYTFEYLNREKIMQTKTEQEAIIYYFGNNNAKKIQALSLEEALEEFVLFCIDFSEFSNKHNYLQSLYEEPFGYTNGKRNANYSKHRYYEEIHVWNENPYYQSTKDNKEKTLVYTLTLSEFRNFHLKQKNVLTHDTSVKEESNSGEVMTKSMIQMKNHIIQTSQKIREVKQKMALERKFNSFSVKSESNKLQEEIKRIQGEHDFLQKKMGVLQTYVGIGRDIVKVCSGKKSDKKTIDVFQSFRYMKEDIELLTDFEEFDARNLEDFDTFISEHYKELLPSEKCIQAFKVTQFKIQYDDAYLEKFMDNENKKVFILARNGNNVYRMYNDYKLHEESLFMLEDPEEEMNYIIQNEIKKNSFHLSDELKKLQSSLIGKMQGDDEGDDERIGFGEYAKVCAIPFEYDEKILEEFKEIGIAKYEAELKRRNDYIDAYGLESELTPYSWRWGSKSMGDFLCECYMKYNDTRKKMEFVRAFKKNDFLTVFSLLKRDMNTYMYQRNHNEEADICKPNFETGIAICRANLHRNSDIKNDFSDCFDPVTAEPLEYYTLWFDFDKYLHYAKEEAREYLEMKFKDESFKNFNSMAVLQNIFDSKQIFDEKDVDLLFMGGVENLNFIKDNSKNLIGSENTDKKNTTIDSLLAQELKKGQFVYIARKSGEAIIEGRYGTKKEENYPFGRHQIVRCAIMSTGCNEVKVRGHLDVYKNSSWEKEIGAGDAKIATMPIRGNWIIFRSDIKENDILEKLKNRHFRETKYQTDGLLLKSLLKFIRSGAEYNFSGGSHYER